MKGIAILYVLLITTMLSCSKRELNSEAIVDCSTVQCTYDLRWITLRLVDQLGNAVAIDRMKVTHVADGKELTRAYESNRWEAFRRLGSYPIFGDLDADKIPRFKHTKLRFQGFIGNREVVNADYTVAFDCCHISLVAGETELVIGR